MENILTPSLGSNQHITKFDKETKTETKTKKKVKPSLLRLKFEVSVVILLLAVSSALTYVVKDNYVWTCTGSFDGIEQSQWGHFGHLMKKTTCAQIVQMKIDSITQPSNYSE